MFQRSLRRCFKILFAFAFLNFIYAGEFSFGDGQTYSLNSLIKQKLKVSKTGSKSHQLELVRSQFSSNEFFLDFENKVSSDLKDKTGNYIVSRAAYTVVEGESFQGKRYASFTNKDSQILISTDNARLLSKKIISDSFYFSFHIMPGELEQNSNIFHKTYITNGKKYGIDCSIVSNYLEVTFHNFFYFNSKLTYTYKLKSQNPLPSKKWTHIFISLEPINGLVKLYENGKETDRFLALNNKEDKTPLLVGFHPNDTNPLIIGKSFYGSLDNFMIGYGSFEDVQQLTIPYPEVKYIEEYKFPAHSKGTAISKVLKTPYSFSIPYQLSYTANIPEGTSLEILYRFSELPFEETDTEPSWKHYDPKTFVDEKNTYFQFFQWKVIMKSNYSGSLTPTLSNFTLKYKESKPPSKPFGLKVSHYDHDNLKVCLSWNSNHEIDVINGGGYLIHYGVSPERMVSTLEVDSNLNKITGLNQNESLSEKYNSLNFCIDNSVIEINAERRREKNLLFLRNGITYYFKVTAYNNKYPWNKVLDKNDLVGFDQKSIPSDVVHFTFRSKANESN